MKFPSPEFDQAVSELCHGTIDDVTIDELHGLLQRDAAARDAYLWQLEIHAELMSGCLDGSLCNASDNLHPESEEPLFSGEFSPASKWEPADSRLNRFSSVIGWVAALFLCLVGYQLYTSLSEESVSFIRSQQQRSAEQKAPPQWQTAPSLAIVIDQSLDAVWDGLHPDWGLGHALGRQRTRLASGDATLQLANGVELMLRGPSDIELLTVDHAVLHRGRVSARVPEGAIGFRLDAPGLNVVDLGTEFSLAVDEAGASQVHVFEGKVRAALPSLPSSRTELLTGETARFDTEKGVVTRRESDADQFPLLDEGTGLPTTQGNLFLLRKPPPSVRTGTFEHESILVFREQGDVELPRPVNVVRGITHQFKSTQTSVPEIVELPAGTRVQSYLVHFDRIGGGRTGGVTAHGSILFDQPILGFVLEPKWLGETDSYCCHEQTQYDNGIERPLEMRYFSNVPDGHDEVHLSDDGHEADVTLQAGPFVDQFRILVEVPGQ